MNVLDFVSRLLYYPFSFAGTASNVCPMLAAVFIFHAPVLGIEDADNGSRFFEIPAGDVTILPSTILCTGLNRAREDNCGDLTEASLARVHLSPADAPATTVMAI